MKNSGISVEGILSGFHACCLCVYTGIGVCTLKGEVRHYCQLAYLSSPSPPHFSVLLPLISLSYNICVK